MENNKGRFVKGHKTWNKGIFGWQGAMVCASEDKIPVRSYNGKVYMHQRRMSYAKWLMEKELGRKLESNEVVYHIDGDKFNNELSNLEVITRAELLKRNEKR